MNTPGLKSMSVDELVEHFVETAIAEEEAILGSITADDDPTREPSVQRMHDLFAELRSIDRELRSRGRQARLALLKLYDHPNAQVNLEAARYTLGVAPEMAQKRLRVIADSGWAPQWIDARSIVEALDSGVFKPD